MAETLLVTREVEGWTMGVMTAMPRTGEEWTVDDLDRLPDDGLQYELLDGLLVVTPAPVLLHQRAVGNLHLVLRQACPPGLEVFFSPVDWRPDVQTSLQPDLLVVRTEDVAVKNFTVPLVLAVEVLSPSTRRKDLVLKRSKYEDTGVQSYWLVDPEEPSVLALDLAAGRYVSAGEAHGSERLRLQRPFEVELVPAELVAPPPG